MRHTLFALGLIATAALAASPAAAQSTPAPKPAKPGTSKPKTKAEELFDKADRNHDGKVSKEEFRRVAAGLPVLKIKAADADKLFVRLDVNKDGFLTKEEIKQLPDRLKGMVSKEAAKGLFDKLKGVVVGKIEDKLKKADKNKDGKLDKKEFCALIVGLKLPKVNAAAADKLFVKLDVNKDGFIDKAEAKKLPGMLKELVPSLGKAGLQKLGEKLKDSALGVIKGIF